MRFFPTLLFLLLTCSTLFALTLEVDKKVYMKGETINITGNSEADQSVMVSIDNGDRNIYSKQVQGGDFLLEYDVSPLDPQGVWHITASTDIGMETATIAVRPSQEGAYYLVRFTSPPYEGVKYLRTDTLPISVSVTDSSKPLSGAKAVAWIGKKRIELRETSDGNYRGDYIIPTDEELGFMELYAIVEKVSEGISYGGEKSTRVHISQVSINVEFLSPTTTTYKNGETVSVEANITYSTGVRVTESVINADANGAVFQMAKNGDIYTGKYRIREEDQGILRISLNVQDNAGNKGYAYKNLEIKGYTEQAIAEYYWYIAVLAVVIIAVMIFLVRKYMRGSNLTNLRKEKEDLIAMEKALQEDYIKKGLMDRGSFEKRMSVYESRIAEIDEKIKHLKTE